MAKQILIWRRPLIGNRFLSKKGQISFRQHYSRARHVMTLKLIWKFIHIDFCDSEKSKTRTLFGTTFTHSDSSSLIVPKQNVQNRVVGFRGCIWGWIFVNFKPCTGFWKSLIKFNKIFNKTLMFERCLIKYIDMLEQMCTVSVKTLFPPQQSSCETRKLGKQKSELSVWRLIIPCHNKGLPVNDFCGWLFISNFSSSEKLPQRTSGVVYSNKIYFTSFFAHFSFLSLSGGLKTT